MNTTRCRRMSTTQTSTRARKAGAASRVLRGLQGSIIVVSALTALAFALRFYKISHPDQVVFDEVHFGKFAAYYITHQYYFDVHPPLARCSSGWLAGSYITNNVPYVGMRALPAVLGSLTVPVVYAIMKESGFSTLCCFSASLILFDNAHVAQSRLILLTLP
ncbi:hypothetical protein D9611_014640 [Ephemerocybe angulata]|uniref:ArnT-like N-terminal domain-containing protein n=1 Tax=Ephemerocybe angulata TaxID=980116 RepID=A0A8H5BSL6_9AGAR|nr:hypothetical protein D9611_014640 [Tulosesus angulatus]